MDATPTAPSVVEQAVRALRSGAAIVIPTDTVYGVAALPDLDGATEQLWALKGRDEQKPLAVLVADERQALDLLDLDDAANRRARAWIARFWPGALTIVGRRSRAAMSLQLGSHHLDTIGVRRPASPIVGAIAAITGPIAVTSANRSGEATATTASAAAAALDGPVALVVDGGPAGTVASTVVDLTVEPWTVRREGGVTVEQLRDIDPV